MVFGNRNFAATLAFAGVFTGATVVAGFATTLPLAVILAFAIMLRRGGTTAVTLAGVLACTTTVAAFAASLALAVVHAFARVLFTAWNGLFSSRHAANLRANKNPGHCAEQQFVEISSTCAHTGAPYRSVRTHITLVRDRRIHPSQYPCK